jgi:acetyltransferase-like isoleucine patch superfamily enzyme
VTGMAGDLISKDARIGGNCRFGHNVVIEGGATLGDGVTLGHGVIVHKAARLGDGVEVGSYSMLGVPPRVASTSRLGAGPEGPLVIGAGTYIGASTVLNWGGELGPNCYVGDLAALREGISFGESVMVGRYVHGARVTVGDRARIQTGTVLIGVIEEDVFMGPYVICTDDRFMRMWEEKTHVGPTVRKEASIGASACLLSGITVGEGAVVGLGAVVISDVPPRRIYVGVPARDAGETRSI